MGKLHVTAALVLALSSLCVRADVGEWGPVVRRDSWVYLLENVSPPGTAQGVIVASPSKIQPDYWYHWTRDAALVMNVVVDRYVLSSGAQRAGLENLLLD